MKLINCLLVILSIVVLAGCTDVLTTTRSIEDKLPSKIEKQLDKLHYKENTGLKLFSNNKDTYYIIYDTANELDGFPGMWETENNGVILKIVSGKALDEPKRYIYKIQRSTLYDSIEVEKNGLPSAFDLVGSY